MKNSFKITLRGHEQKEFSFNERVNIGDGWSLTVNMSTKPHTCSFCGNPIWNHTAYVHMRSPRMEEGTRDNPISGDDKRCESCVRKGILPTNIVGLEFRATRFPMPKG